MPLPTTAVIGRRWSEHHRRTATATMTAECVITRRVPADAVTGVDGVVVPAPPQTVYTGVCRVYLSQTNNERLLARGETQETHRRYQVAIVYDADDIRVGDLVEITESVDGGLVGKKLRVLSRLPTSEQWQRNLICDELEA